AFRRAVARAEGGRDPLEAAWALLAAERLSQVDAELLGKLRDRVRVRGEAPGNFPDARQAYMRGMRYWATGEKAQAADVFRKALRGQDKNVGRYLSHAALFHLEQESR